mgnify:CR=1 FL=1
MDSKMPKAPCPMETKVGTLFNFNADKKITDTLSKIMDWAIKEEEYEMCNEIKTIQQNYFEYF